MMSFSDTPQIEEWIPYTSFSKSRTGKVGESQLAANLTEESNGKKTLRLKIGNDILRHLGVEFASDQNRLMLLVHPDNECYFMLARASQGYKLLKGSRYYQCIMLSFNHHKILNRIDGDLVEYSVHPNKTISFKLKNSPKKL